MKRNKIVLIGDSITDSFPVENLLKGLEVINKGISGDNTEEVYNRLDEDVIKLKPDIVFVLIGTNDFAQGRTNDQIENNISLIHKKLIAYIPSSIIYAVSILPVRNMENRPNDRIVQVNKSIIEITKDLNINYLDLHKEFHDNEGELKMEYTEDGLHLTYTGYEMWSEILRKKIESLNGK